MLISSFAMAFNKYPALSGLGADFAITRISMQSRTEFSKPNPRLLRQRFSSLLFRSIIAL